MLTILKSSSTREKHFVWIHLTLVIIIIIVLFFSRLFVMDSHTNLRPWHMIPYRNFWQLVRSQALSECILYYLQLSLLIRDDKKTSTSSHTSAKVCNLLSFFFSNVNICDLNKTEVCSLSLC